MATAVKRGGREDVVFAARWSRVGGGHGNQRLAAAVTKRGEELAEAPHKD